MENLPQYQFAGANITLGGDLIANAITLAPTSTFNVGGNIASVNTPITFPSAVVLNTNAVISTGAGGNITFSSTLNGASPDTQNLTLSAGTGNILFSGDVGTNFLTRPNLINIASANNVSIGNMAVNGLIQTSGSGTTTISGSLSIVNNIGFQFTGTNLNVQNTASIQTTMGSSVTIHNNGLLTFAGSANPDGSFIQNGSGSTNFSGSIATNLGGISFTGPVAVSGTSTMDTSSNNQPITFSNTLDGPGNFTLKAGTGNVTLLGNTGSSSSLGATTVASAGILPSKTSPAAPLMQLLRVLCSSSAT